MSTVGNDTTGASSTGPASGYNLMLSHLFIVFFLFLYRLSINTNNPYTTIMLLIFTHNRIYFIIFEIKICHKITKTLRMNVPLVAVSCESTWYVLNWPIEESCLNTRDICRCHERDQTGGSCRFEWELDGASTYGRAGTVGQVKGQSTCLFTILFVFLKVKLKINKI
jgi:hypothetical protein